MEREPGGRPSRTRVAVRWSVALVVVVALLGAGAAVSALTAAPAHAFDGWQHDGATDCASCHTGSGTPGDSSCTFCHGTTFKSVPGYNCWSCHVPGDVASIDSYKADCSQICHLFNRSGGGYNVDFSHGTDPHLGASGFGKTCLDCHSVSTNNTDADGSPHHSGVTMSAPTCAQCHDGTTASKEVNHDSVKPQCTACHTAMNIPPQPSTCNKCHARTTFGTRVCTSCHSPRSEGGLFTSEQVHNTKPSVGACTSCHKGLQKHAGKVTCTKCHTTATKFHHKKATSPGFPKCSKCHSKTHDGWHVPTSRCGSCHRGTNTAAGRAVQHSAKITRTVRCSNCHSLQVHASAFGSRLSCASCHGGSFHGAKPIPSSGTCLRCHGSARSHAVGFPCLFCHRSAVHNARPSAGGVIGR